jgi:hypothetical protein
MNHAQRKSHIIITLPIIIFLIIPTLILAEPRIGKPAIEVIEGDEVDEPAELLLSCESYAPENSVTLLNQTTLDRSRWNIMQGYASYELTVPIVNVSAVIIGLTVKALDESLQINMSEYNTKVENSTSLAPNESDHLQIQIPYLLMRSSFRGSWFEKLYIILGFVDHDFDDFVVTNFWIQALTLEDLYPITMDIQRTNGESLYSNPTSVGLWDDPEIHFNYSTLGDSTLFKPAQVNETLLLPPGYYEISLRWGDNNLTGEVTLSNNSALVYWRVKCVRIDVGLTQDISGLSITIQGYSDLYYLTFLLVYSPSFYMPPGQYVSIVIQSSSSAYSGLSRTLLYLALGENMNITVTVNPGLISIGNVSMTLGRILIFSASFLFVASLVLVMILKRASIDKLLPLLILFIGIVLPWMQFSWMGTYPYSTPIGVNRETWMLSPGIFTSYFLQDNFSVAIGPAGGPVTEMFRINIGSLVLFLFLLLLVGSLLEWIPNKPAIRNYQFLFLFGLIVLLEFCALISWTGYANWREYFVIGPGPIVALFALAIWVVLYVRAARASANPANVG